MLQDVDRHVLGASDAIPTNERHVCVEGKEVPNISSFVTDIVDILQFIVRVSSQSVGETGKLSENKAGSGLMSLTGMGRSLSSSASNHDNGSQGNGTGTGNGHGHGNSNINQSLVTQLSRLGDSAHTQQVAMRMEETLKECVSLSMCLLIGVYQSASWTAMENSADAFTHVLARLSKSVVPTNATKPATNATKPATKPPTPGAGTSIANELDTHPYMAGNGTGVGSGGSSVLGHLLVTTASIDLRNEAAVGLRMLSKALTLEDKEHLLGAFASLLRVVPKESTQCQDLFDLVSAVVQSLPSTQPTSHDSAIVVLMNVLMDRLLTHPPMETHRTGEPDVFLGCLLRLLGNVASKGGIPTDTPSHTGTVAQVPKGNAPTRYILDELVQFVTKKCLFDMPTLTNHGPRSPPLCKTAESRTIARELLDTLGRSTMFGTRVRHLLCGLLMDTHCGGKESGGSELTVLSRMHTDESVVAATSASGRASTRADTTASATATRTPSHTSTSKDASLVVACGCEGVCVNDVCDVACGEGLCGADPELSGGVTRIQERSASGYVGLENLGATCYMNSLMQNLFMVPQFRRGVLATRTKPWTTTPPTPHALVLHQLQMIFAHLQESLLKCYSAQGFCSVYESEGACVDVNLQMDVDEFFNVLFDRLEALLKGSPQQSLLKDTFGGKLLQQVISKDCEHVSEREQDLFSIQCDVVNKQNIRESLAMYVKGEMLEGDNKYYCEKCDLKVAAEKRVSVQSLPNHLIFHLKRFEFDMELMRRVKVNDRYEFPPVLDMFPFTLEGLMAAERAEKGEPPLPREHPDDHYIYDLGGILVHKGSADSGHYYSIISDWEVEKTNSGEATSHHNSAGDNSFGGRWMLFDDSNVRDFNAKVSTGHPTGGCIGDPRSGCAGHPTGGCVGDPGVVVQVTPGSVVRDCIPIQKDMIVA
ncbi:hypothetical protein SARC_02698 [Sphaeroforma arctica JP610]|uniref:Ubiquitin carboxyl-terminal hydrolase n=1 Tax=Sphaeroforma arctica JP610 TaxID=667725 RepID=A0A0L0GA47_9EUKA|nr:hypothetical protein SARC_02698 [Sphaeroforma arctica JP610]KNC85108.1 hypothetical protein SARC_02698 [Sphaeroforma arctica JP610]|eukprot:XP_014159010.1 hypothetical protein SARC_02698 [Sphaeroforma arctica JP610]